MTLSPTLSHEGRLKTARRRLQKHRSIRVLDMIALAVIALVLLAVIIGPIIAPSSAFTSHIGSALQAPSSRHLLGTDDQGRDVLWRIIAGARDTVLSSVVIVTLYALIGSLIAVVAVFGGKWVDEALMRFTDLMLAVPNLILALGFAAALGPKLKTAIIAMVITGWPMTARLLRGIMMETMALPFTDGATVLGASRWRLILRHVIPNSMDVLIVKWTADVGFTALLLSSLSFIGAGAQPPSPAWGAMVSEAQTYITTGWWAALFPGLAIALSAAAFGLAGDLLQWRLNPELSSR